MNLTCPRKLPRRSARDSLIAYPFLKEAQKQALQKNYEIIVAKKICSSSAIHVNGTYEFQIFQNLFQFSKHLITSIPFERTYCFIMRNKIRCLYLDIDVKITPKQFDELHTPLQFNVNSIYEALVTLILKNESNFKEILCLEKEWQKTFYAWDASRKIDNNTYKFSLHIINQNIKFKDTEYLKQFVFMVKSQTYNNSIISMIFNEGIDLSPYNCVQYWRTPLSHNGEPLSSLMLVSKQTISILEQLKINICDGYAYYKT